MHGFHANEARDYLRTFDWGREPHLLDDEEIARGAFCIAQEAGFKTPSSIEGKEECNKALNSLVDAFWKRCKARLGGINRGSLVTRCLLNNERLLCERDDWRRTSRAVLSLHVDREGVLRSTQLRRVKRDRMQITSRVLVEMAICACPEEGGQSASEADIDFLCGQIAFLIATASQSDVVRSGSVDASIKISASGEIDYGEGLNDLIFPYLTSVFDKEHIADVQRYEELFEARAHGTKTEEEIFGPAFVECFRAEYGISPVRLAQLAVMLTEDAIEQRSLRN